MAILTAIMLACISQAVKLIMRVSGVSKRASMYIVFGILFILTLIFTAGKTTGFITQETITLASTIFFGAIGAYEMLLNKTGLDSLMKNITEIKRSDDKS